MMKLADNKGYTLNLLFNYEMLSSNIDNNNYRILRSKDHKEYKTNLKIYINWSKFFKIIYNSLSI